MNEEVAGAVTEEIAETGGQQATNSNFVLLDDILSEAQDNDAGNPEAAGQDNEGEKVDNAGDDNPTGNEPETESNQSSTTYRTQAEFDAAFSKRMAKERERNRPYVDMGKLVNGVTGGELTDDEVKEAISNALAEKRSRANKTDIDTELNNIRVEQRIASRYGGNAEREYVNHADDGVKERANEMVATINAIGDDSFTIDALRSNQQAMEYWAKGATPAQVYKSFFAASQSATTAPRKVNNRPSPERSANSGATGTGSRRLTSAEYAKINDALDKGFDVRI